MPAFPDDEQMFQPVRNPNSTVRYRTTEGHEAIRLGNQEIIVHHEPVQRRFHWLLFYGLGMLATLVLFLIGQWSVAAWNAHTLDSQYGYPRTWQTDQVVGHDDNQAHPSHFTFENLDGQVFFIEIPGGHLDKARIYPVQVLYGADVANIPVTATFKDVNSDGRIDIIVEIGTAETSVFLNTGSGFAPEK